MTKTNYLVLLLKEYLRCYDVHPDSNQLRIILESDPSFPSLLSIRQTCNYFGIKTNAYKGDYDALLENKLKKWCPLCLGVVGLVVLENLVFLLFPEKVIQNSTFGIAGIPLLTSLIFSILIVHFFNKLIITQEDALINKLWNLQLKRNPAVLFSLFNRQKKSEIPQKHSIVIGNQESPVVITALLSPMCKPCKRMTNEILQLTEKHPESFLWQIRFDGIAKEVYDPLNRIQLHIKQLCDNEKDNGAKIKIIKDWYSRQSFQWFASRYPIDIIAPETIVGFAEHINENAKLNVNRVPVLWINNRMLPQEYSVTDIPFLCTDVNLLFQLTK
ncbi:MAG: hypothetical protein ACOC10_02035 [Bacteroidota bacterium]